MLLNRVEGPVPDRIARFAPRRDGPAASDSPGGFYDAASRHREALEAIGTRLLAHARSVTESHGVTDVEIVRPSGHAAREILDDARERAVDTIVVGCRGHAPPAEWLPGSVAHEIQNPCDGWVVTVP